VSRPRLLFVTYYRLTPTTQIGVLKRCMRIVRNIIDEHEIHLVNFGPLPDEDALFSELRPRLTVHTPEGGDDLGPELVRLFTDVDPGAVVFGETPLRGSMRLAHRVATARDLWQVCIENHYGDFVERFFPAEWPRIDRWLALGLTGDGQPERTEGRMAVVPPLVRFPPPGAAPARDRVVILGYDQQTLRMGALLARRLPASLPIDLVVSPGWEELLPRARHDFGGPGRRVLLLPGDEALYDALARARLVLGKAGFQQVVESVAMGAPIVCQICGGGIDGNLVADHLKPYVRFVAEERDLDRVMFDVAGWLLEPPALPWAALAAAVPDPAALAARRLRELVAADARGAPARAAAG
jgi:hypothetical protein